MLHLLLLCLLAGQGLCKNPYKVLGVDDRASAADIKRAYKKLAVRYHPDKVTMSQEKPFVPCAHTVLSFIISTRGGTFWRQIR